MRIAYISAGAAGMFRGVVITRALSHLEEHLGKPVRQVFQLAAGTSTGSIISAAIGAGLTAVPQPTIP